ncbi:formyl transferase, partial [bacterium]
MRVAFVGCVQSSRAFLARLLELPDVEVAGVVTREASAFNADFASLRPLAEGAGVPCFIARGNDQAALADWLRRLA